MKITKIEIENINSLKGYWCIDLSHPDYKKNHDLFVICGETGSGKTTLLDAITLALYGKTPRINSFTNQNELMTRHTANCMARVTYECKKGKFVSEFEQHRSKNRIEGNLQAPTAQITNLDTGKLEPNLSITALQAKTAEIIQLDYSQFCRSILLAQGKFDDFISGDSKQKAEILAKLNGTEKYKDFANQLWIKASKQINKYKVEKENLEKIKVLTEEEVIQNESLIQKNEKQVKKNQKKLDEIEEIINWLGKLKELEEKTKRAKKERENYEQAVKDFSDKDEILQNAQKAKNCNSSFVAFNQLKSEQAKDKSELDKKIDDCNKSEVELQNSQEVAKKNKELYESKSKFQAENEKLWRLVSELDAKLQVEKEKFLDAEKRFRESSKELEQKKKNYKEFVETEKKLEKSIEVLGLYLSENRRDEKLGEIALFIGQKNESFVENLDKIEKNEIKLKTEEKKIETTKEDIEKLETELLNQNTKLKDFVNKEYLSISVLLRSTLKNGIPCPVCGSVDHPSCMESKSVGIGQENHVAVNAGDILNEIEKLESDKTVAEQKLKLSEKEVERLEEENKQLKEKNCNLIFEINKNIRDWNFELAEEKFAQQFDNVLAELNRKAEEFKSKNEQKNQDNLKLKTIQAAIEQIDINDLEQKAQSEAEKFAEEENLYLKMQQERSELFGNLNVDEERKNFEKEISSLKKSFEDSEECKNKCKENHLINQNSVKALENRIIQREPEVKKSEIDFSRALTDNGIESEEKFKKYLVSEDELSELVKIKETLKTEDSKTKTQLENAKHETEACLKLDKTRKTEDEVSQEKNELIEQNNKLNQEIGNINNVLRENSQNQDEYKNKKIQVEQLEQEKVTWERIQEILGTKDGGDFEVFVEALAFKQLLIKANAYVYAISGKYTLVQKEGQVDFLVHDDNYPDAKEDRPVVNMSGGEKFIISLSLALGIAELASQNVQVDSLFLDEGFGTLSGEPLVEAVNALKSLQSSGRMLGIITHIDGVIREFDQKIVAKKKSGGVSELIGSGITCS